MADKTHEWSVADDSGLCLQALDGDPGVYSARWAQGEDLVEFTLAQMKDHANRACYFEGCVALVSPAGQEYLFSGRVRGELSMEARGEARTQLPYDQIFIPKGYDQTFAEMSDKLKNNMSHRGQAFEKLKKFICLELI